MNLEVVPDPWLVPEPDPAWIIQHAGDEIPVKLIDLLSVVQRLTQCADDPDAHPVTHERLFTCDLPRLRAYLPDRALEEL